MILADTSAWVEYDRATGSAVDRRLAELIAGDGPLAVTEPVLMEVIAGARGAVRERALRGLLLRFELLPFEAVAVIASVARRHDATLLAHDADFARIARVVGIDLDDAATRL